MYKLVSVLLFMNAFMATTVAQKEGMRLLTYNIRNSKGMDNKVDYDRAVTVLQQANADVFALQEIDSITKRSAGVDVLQVLAEKTGLHAVYGAAIPLQGGKYGVGVLSKEKPLRHYTVPLPGKEEERVLLVVEYSKYVIFCTHFSLTEADRMTSVALINEQATKYKKPIYLMGDLNAEPSSPVLHALKKQWQLLSDETPTFPAPEPSKCIDYVLSRNAKRDTTTSTVINEPMVSDHRPVLVVVNQ